MSIALTITLIFVLTVTIVLTNCLPQSNLVINTNMINNPPHQSPAPTNITQNNATGNNTTNYHNTTSEPLITVPSLIETSHSKLFTYNQSLPIFYSLLWAGSSLQMSGSDKLMTNLGVTDFSSVSLDASMFVAYAYGGYPVQQNGLTQFLFLFPDLTNQGQLAGSDAVTYEKYAIQRMDFDASFVTPKVGAYGFDEMAIFAASDTTTYKGIEFGVRMDLKNGFIYGYIQEPEGMDGEVSFQMLELMFNDGVMHHYTLVAVGFEVSFFIDGADYGYLSFPSGTDYSDLSFSVCVVVHRFSDLWDSNGDFMIVDNFLLNQQ